MIYVTVLLSFVFGTIIGSFLNVLILRYNTGRSLGGRSACPHCNKELFWYELIPIVSYVIQLGRCNSCGVSISAQYPLVELSAGVVFASIILKETFHFVGGDVFRFSFTAMCLLLAWSLIIAITAYDIRHKIIPNSLVWALVFISFIKLFAYAPLSLNGFLAGPVLALPFALIWLISGGRAMGLGDAKLSLGLGWMLGLAEGVSMLLLSFWIGGIVSLYLLLQRHGGFTMKSEIPFAPFLVLGAFTAYILNLDIAGIANLM